ncbi:hypothetical protein Hypma_012663 [Hypsizygus marmoreus]|uniref:Uncharacterized protein n=1 Tax=Hypsizygus marmoreus TaxID=39966 RepID=A0A369JDM9_HYPMA|nr:hypothetical protein Hypma_012663 [Hypsizygus marmoreus]
MHVLRLILSSCHLSSDPVFVLSICSCEQSIIALAAPAAAMVTICMTFENLCLFIRWFYSLGLSSLVGVLLRLSPRYGTAVEMEARQFPKGVSTVMASIKIICFIDYRSTNKLGVVPALIAMVLLCLLIHRQRKALFTVFSNSAVRDLTPVFYDSAYTVRYDFPTTGLASCNSLTLGLQVPQLKASWDTSLQSTTQNDRVTIYVQACSDIAGFLHDFGSLSGKSSPILLVIVTAARAPLFALVFKVPSGRKKELDSLAAAVTVMDIENELTKRAKSDETLDRSIIEALGAALTTDSACEMGEYLDTFVSCP